MLTKLLHYINGILLHYINRITLNYQNYVMSCLHYINKIMLLQKRCNITLTELNYITEITLHYLQNYITLC